MTWWAPFTTEQVAALNARQQRTKAPYECPRRRGNHGVLVAVADGWSCKSCNYSLRWAHEVVDRSD